MQPLCQPIQNRISFMKNYWLHKEVTAWFSKGKNYMKKCLLPTHFWMIFLSPTRQQLRGFAEARTTG